MKDPENSNIKTNDTAAGAEKNNALTALPSNNGSSDNSDYVDYSAYSQTEIAKSYANKLLPFAAPGKSHIYGIISLLLASAFFALPGIISILSFVLPQQTFLNYIATQTFNFMQGIVVVLYIMAAWFLIGHLIGCYIYKKPILSFSNYAGAGDFIWKNKVRILFAVLLVIMTIISYNFSVNKEAALTNSTDGLFIWYKVALGAVCISLIKDKKHIHWLLMIFGISAILTTFVMFRQYILYYMKVDPSLIWSTDFSAITPNVNDLPHLRGIFSNSNHYGYYLTMGALAVAGLLVTAKRLWQTIFWCIGFAILTNAVILNDTLGTIVAVVLIVLLVPVAFIRSDVKWYKRFIPIAIMVAVMAFVTAFPQLPMGSNVLRNAFNEIKGAFQTLEKADADNNNDNNNNTDNTDKTGDSSNNDYTADSGKENSNGSSDMSSSSSDAASDTVSESTLTTESSATTKLNNEKEIVSETETKLSSDGDHRWWLKNQELGTARLGLWQYALELMSKKPLTGYGALGTKMMFERDSGLDAPAARVHNEYLQIGLDFGIPAMIIHLTALFTVVAYFFAAMAKGKLNNMQRILFIMFAAYAISAFTGICAYYTASYFYLILALLVSTFEGTVHEYPTEAKAASAVSDSTEADSENVSSESESASASSSADTDNGEADISDTESGAEAATPSV